jgi:hypothetical protein
VADIIEWPEISWQPPPHLCSNMSQLNNAQPIQQEGRIELALQALQYKQFRSAAAAATAFNVPARTLRRRVRRIKARRDCTLNRQKLTTTEEQTIVRYILDLDSRGFAPRLCEVADMADKLLAARGGELVGKC